MSKKPRAYRQACDIFDSHEEQAEKAATSLHRLLAEKLDHLFSSEEINDWLETFRAEMNRLSKRTHNQLADIEITEEDARQYFDENGWPKDDEENTIKVKVFDLATRSRVMDFLTSEIYPDYLRQQANIVEN